MGVVILISMEKKYTMKERIFLSFAWLSRGSIAATLGSLFYTEAKNRGYDEYMQYGLQIQTHAIIAIMFMAPMGSILLNTFGSKFLTIEKEENKTTATEENLQRGNGENNGMVEPD